MDTGAIAIGLNTSAANAERAGITIDWSDPTPVNGGTATVYPITPDRISIGDAVGQHLPGSVGPTPWEAMTGFDGIGNFTHEFFKPFAVTFDFVGMHLPRLMVLLCVVAGRLGAVAAAGHVAPAAAAVL
ncbi:hypothetical protein [Kitasatospora sp. NPDC050543]|uniref:hypothetical protein n=1 Tax=Kitasatospora sp. NPDC050543 TaxID=3364054 RepID=UPI0037A87B66